MKIVVDRTVIEQALEALENLPALSWIPEQERTVIEAITALRTALEQVDQTTLDVSGHPGSSLIPANWKQAEQKIEMNERIEELFGKALDKAVPHTWTSLSHAEVESVIKVFAELIVRECSNIGEMKEQGYSQFDPDTSVGWYMRQHFGVKP